MSFLHLPVQPRLYPLSVHPSFYQTSIHSFVSTMCQSTKSSSHPNHQFIYVFILSIHLSICPVGPSNHTFIGLSIRPSIYSSVCPATHSSDHPFVQLPIHPTIHSSVGSTMNSAIRPTSLISIRLSIQWSTHPLIHPTVHLSVYLSNKPLICRFICPTIHSAVSSTIHSAICILLLPKTIYLIIHPSDHSSIQSYGWIYIQPSTQQSSISLSNHPCIGPSKHPFLCQSNYPFICPSTLHLLISPSKQKYIYLPSI